jgi:hypothetical protein
MILIDTKLKERYPPMNEETLQVLLEAEAFWIRGGELPRGNSKISERVRHGAAVLVGSEYFLG